MTEDTVNPIEEMIEAVEQPTEAQENVPEEKEETQVPLSALQKERKKRQEMEIENRLLREQQQQRHVEPQEPDESQYESVTRADLGKQTKEVIRQVEERNWIKNNPDKCEKINELLPAFLKKRPNLALAINDAPNRYEEAWELMDKLTPREQQKLKTAPVVKKDAPGSPGSAPKAAILNEAVDVMSMSDSEYFSWRQSKKRAR
jgi:hypothetical protein